MNREYTRFPVQFLRNSTGILQETVFVHIRIVIFERILLGDILRILLVAYTYTFRPLLRV
jgi:hypothetical protein